MRFTAALTVLALLLALSACGGGVSFGGPVGGSTPYTDYFLLGEDIYNIRGSDAGDPAVYEALIELMDGRGFFMGLYSRGGVYDSESTEMRSGNISSRLMGYDGFDFYSLSRLRGYGYLDLFGSNAEVDMDLNGSEGLLPGFDDLRLEGRFDAFDAQDLINDVSFFPFQDASSSFSTPATWRLSGYHYGDFFEVTFEQDLRAIAEYYTIRDY